MNAPPLLAFKIEIIGYALNNDDLVKDVNEYWNNNVVWRCNPYQVCEYLVSTQRFESYELGEIELVEDENDKSKWTINIADEGNIRMKINFDIGFKAGNIRNRHINENLIRDYKYEHDC